jgi:RNA polymerase sigma-70 factor (ECF subfamily)
MDPYRPVFPDLDLTPELLARQGRSLRALARRLLGDSHAAEDVVQDTWLATLQQGASVRGRLSGWLARVVRNRSLQLQRGAGRRRGREHDVARPERLEADPDALLAREEALRAVTGALLELDEPYRVVLLLRFYEDRAPIEIARALGLPPTTVKSRIERGLVLLRARLEARGHGRRGLAGLALLAGRGRWTVTGPVSLGTGALVMGSKLALGAAAAAVVGVLAWFWPEQLAPDSRSADRAPDQTSALVADPGNPLLTPTAGQETTPREPLAVEPGAIVDGGAPEETPVAFTQNLSVVTRDLFGLPLQGATVRIGFRGGRLQTAGSTDASGSYDVAFFTRTARADLLVEVSHGDCSSGLREFSFQSDQAVRLDVGLNVRPGANLTVSRLRLVNLGERVSGTYQLDHGRMGRAAMLDGVFTFEEPPPALDCPREVVTEADGTLGEALQTLAFVSGNVLEVRSQLRLASGTWELAVDGEVHVEGSTARVRGSVRDSHGLLVPGASLALAEDGGPLRWLACADEEGRFDFEVPSDRPLRLRAGGGEAGVDTTALTLRADEIVTWEPLLTRGGEVTGRLVDDEGQGLGGRRIELARGGPSTLWTTTVETRPDGRFAFPNLPGGSFDLVVLAGSGLPCKTVPRVATGEDLGDIVLGVAEQARSSLAIQTTNLAGLPIGGLLRVIAEDSRRALEVHAILDPRGDVQRVGGAVLASDELDRGMRVEGLPAGRYAVEVITDLGEHDLGTVWLDPGASVDLGEERLEPLAWLKVAPDARLDSENLFVRRLHPDVESAVCEIGPGGMLPLRPGRYALEGSGSRVEIEVAAGSVSAWTVASDDPRRITPSDPPALPVVTGTCIGCH